MLSLRSAWLGITTRAALQYSFSLSRLHGDACGVRLPPFGLPDTTEGSVTGAFALIFVGSLLPEVSGVVSTSHTAASKTGPRSYIRTVAPSAIWCVYSTRFLYPSAGVGSHKPPFCSLLRSIRPQSLLRTGCASTVLLARVCCMTDSRRPCFTWCGRESYRA